MGASVFEYLAQMVHQDILLDVFKVFVTIYLK